MKLNYTINHFDFVKIESFILKRYSYIAQSKNGTWHAFTHKPIIDDELQIWKVNMNLKNISKEKEYIIFDPFDGYPENEDWKSQLYGIAEFYKKTKELEWNQKYIGKKITDFIGWYVLFMDGTVGKIGILSNGKCIIKSYSNLYTTTYNQKFDFIEIDRPLIDESGIMIDPSMYKEVFNQKPWGNYSSDYTISSCYQIATILAPNCITDESLEVSKEVPATPTISVQPVVESFFPSTPILNERDDVAEYDDESEDEEYDDEELEDEEYDDEEYDDEELEDEEYDDEEYDDDTL